MHRVTDLEGMLSVNDHIPKVASLQEIFIKRMENNLQYIHGYLHVL